MGSRILIIDDMADFRLLVKTLLGQVEEIDAIDELEGASNADAINAIVSKNYDLILLDYQLDSHDGLGVMKLLRQSGYQNPVILLTAYGDEKLAVRAIKEGAYDYLPKMELNAESLASTVLEALKDATATSTEPALFGDHIKVNGYRPIQLLGRGGNSMVYLAENEVDHNQVVLKIMMNTDVNTTDIERFLREYEIMSAFEHESIGQIYEQSFSEDIMYILMEHLDGGSLKSRIKKHGAYTEAEATTLMVRLYDTLDYIHSHGVLHRDIKPDNILFRHDNTPVIIDFGIAAKLNFDEGLTAHGTVVGTPAYMSPEQARGKGATVLSDIYSLGVVYYELLTGKRPFTGTNPHQVMYRLVHDIAPPLPDHLQHLQDIMNRLLDKNPIERFNTARQVSLALQASMQPA